MTPANPLQNLITQLCPQGVEWKTLGEIGTFYGGLNGKTKKDFENGNARYISYMNIFNNLSVDLEAHDFVKIKPNENQRSIDYGDVLFTGSSETREECGISAVVTKRPSESIYLNSFCFGFRFKNQNLISPEFAKFLFQEFTIRKQIIGTASGVTRYNISKKKMAQVKIPIPPLEIQNRIVEILDTFTELERELERELSARKKQYEFYRNALLSLEFLQELSNRLAEGAKIRMCSLREVCEKVFAGGDLPKQYTKNKIPTEEFPYPIYSNGSNENSLYGYSNSYKVDSEAVTISARGTIGFHTIRKAKFTPIVRLITLIPQTSIISSKFLNYALHTTRIEHAGTEVGIPQLTIPMLEKIQIPLPPIEVQNEVVEILDRFDAMVNSIKEGLPAEINARKKQYEYYRDRLLSFETKA